MELIALAVLVVAGQWLLGLTLATTVADRVGLGSADFAALVPLLGLIALGTTTLLVGHLALLGPWLPWVLLAVSILGVAVARRRITERVRLLRRAVVAQWRLAPVSVSAIGLGLVMAVVASFAPPFRIDEIEYHWAAPVEWAAVGRWVDSSYRHVDSFPFMEIAYTDAATVGSYAGAHLIHLSTLVALGAAAAAAARTVGVRATGAVAAATVAMPVVWDQSYAAYNDVAVGAFSMSAASLALRGRWTRGSILLTMLLLATAISIKPTALGAVGVVGLIVLMDALRKGGSVGAVSRKVVRVWVPLVLTAAVTLGAWTLRRYLLTGTWIDADLTAPPTADELTRLPDTTDQLLAPIMPFVLGVVGANPPWGGRTALVLQLFLIPALIYVVWRRGRVGVAFARVAVPAWTHWVVVGLQGVRTRFHLITWALLVVAVRVAVEDASRRHPRLGAWLGMTWAVAVVLGVIDSAFEMMRIIRTIDLRGG